MGSSIATPNNEKFENLFDTFDKMTVLELSQFIKAYETRYGVSAQHAPSNYVEKFEDSVETVEVVEKAEFEVELVAAGTNRIAVIKAVREILNLGLADSKALVDKAPVILKTGLTKADADTLTASLKEVGAEVEIK